MPKQKSAVGKDKKQKYAEIKNMRGDKNMRGAPFTTTRCAGKFTPQARVAVHGANRKRGGAAREQRQRKHGEPLCRNPTSTDGARCFMPSGPIWLDFRLRLLSVLFFCERGGKRGT